MESFSFYLKNERSRSYDRIAILVVIINVVVFAYIALSTDLRETRGKAIEGLIIITTCFIIDYLIKRLKKNKGFLFTDFLSFGIIIAWVIMGYWIAALVNFLLSTFYFIAKRKLLVTVEKEQILYPSFPVKTINWNEVSSVIIKDGLLTIDLKNNRLIQQVIDEDSRAIDENEFNQYCTEQLKKSKLTMQ